MVENDLREAKMDAQLQKQGFNTYNRKEYPTN